MRIVVVILLVTIGVKSFSQCNTSDLVKIEKIAKRIEAARAVLSLEKSNTLFDPIRVYLGSADDANKDCKAHLFVLEEICWTLEDMVEEKSAVTPKGRSEKKRKKNSDARKNIKENFEGYAEN